MPKLYITPEMQINAFATGRDPKHAAVAVTTGALQRLNKTELQGVLAHELSHVGNRDILVSTVAAILAGIISLVADIFLRSLFFGGMGRGRGRNSEAGEIFFIVAIVLSILAPIGTVLIQLAISRRREALADGSGVLLTRYPEGLISALRKIQADNVPMASAKDSTAHMWIDNPFKGTQTSWWHKLFMTHPPIEESIAALEKMEGARMKYKFSKTVVVALGGSIVHPDGIDTRFLKNFKKFLAPFLKRGTRFVLVLGGGALARRFQEAAGGVANVNDEDKDWIGIHATRLNAHLFRTVFRDVANPVIIDSASKVARLRYPVTIAAGWRPGWSTDYVALQIAADLGARKRSSRGNRSMCMTKDPKYPARKNLRCLAGANMANLFRRNGNPDFMRRWIRWVPRSPSEKVSRRSSWTAATSRISTLS